MCFRGHPCYPACHPAIESRRFWHVPRVHEHRYIICSGMLEKCHYAGIVQITFAHKIANCDSPVAHSSSAVQFTACSIGILQWHLAEGDEAIVAAATNL